MTYKVLGDAITNEDILIMAREHIQNGTIPMATRGIGKSQLVAKIIAGMLYLMNKERFSR